MIETDSRVDEYLVSLHQRIYLCAPLVVHAFMCHWNAQGECQLTIYAIIALGEVVANVGAVSVWWFLNANCSRHRVWRASRPQMVENPADAAPHILMGECSTLLICLEGRVTGCCRCSCN